MGVGSERYAPVALPPGKSQVTHCKGGWVVHKAGLEVSGISRPLATRYNKITKIQLFTIKVLTQLPRSKSQTQYENTSENNQTPNQEPQRKKDNKSKIHLITECVKNIITVRMKYLRDLFCT
jgi:hypothetical protein